MHWSVQICSGQRMIANIHIVFVSWFASISITHLSIIDSLFALCIHVEWQMWVEGRLILILILIHPKHGDLASALVIDVDCWHTVDVCSLLTMAVYTLIFNYMNDTWSPWLPCVSRTLRASSSTTGPCLTATPAQVPPWLPPASCSTTLPVSCSLSLTSCATRPRPRRPSLARNLRVAPTSRATLQAPSAHWPGPPRCAAPPAHQAHPAAHHRRLASSRRRRWHTRAWWWGP